jgi:hypothetical protein
MIRPGVSLDHWADAERLTVHAIADLSGRPVESVRDVLSTFGIVPDRIDTVSLLELRDAELIARPGPAGTALRETRTRAR